MDFGNLKSQMNAMQAQINQSIADKSESFNDEEKKLMADLQLKISKEFSEANKKIQQYADLNKAR